jgi:hypothetical protein
MPERSRTSLGVKFLSVVLALFLWLSVSGERAVERRISVPVRLLNRPASLWPTGAPPVVDVVISGPWLTVELLKPELLTLDLDLWGAGAGVTAFPQPEHFLRLPQDVRAVRIFPARIDVRLLTSEQ